LKTGEIFLLMLWKDEARRSPLATDHAEVTSDTET